MQGSTLTASGRGASREFGRTQESMPGEAEHGREVEEDEDEEVLVRGCIREGMGDFSESGFR